MPSEVTDTSSSRAWLPELSQQREDAIRAAMVGHGSDATLERLQLLIDRNRRIHEVECINLNPATNVMNPRAEAALSAGLGSRPSLGYAGAKYEMGLEAIEEIEVIAADLACRVFGARFAEIRVGSGALANLYSFMATCQPGDSIIVPPASIGGHITHRAGGAAGLYGLDIHECPIDGDGFTIDVDALRVLARRVRPRLITLGSSLNLFPHPIREVRVVADEVGADVLFDAAHACGMIAGGVWPNPLAEGADLMTMSTYKSLGGPPGGLVVTDRADLAERIDAIAYPGLTANFDAGKTASLAIALLDWLDCGRAYAAEMASSALALATALEHAGIPVVRTSRGLTTSHQFAVRAAEWQGGHPAAVRLREANILSSAIGLPAPAMTARPEPLAARVGSVTSNESEGAGEWGGIRFGSPEIVRWGMTAAHMVELAELVVDGLRDDTARTAIRVTEFRSQFATLHHIRH